MQATPLLLWMNENGINPYSGISDFLEDTGLTRAFLGDVALGKRRCSFNTLQKIEKASGKEGLAVEMFQYWQDQDSKEPATSHDGYVVDREVA